MSYNHYTPNVKETLFSKDRRFHDYRIINKLANERPGPGEYDLLSKFERDRIKPCTRLVKPELVDEHLYDIVGGTVKILKPNLMNPLERKSHEKAVSKF